VIYLRVEWKHQHPDEPVTLYSELDERRFEVRKLELFRDGRVGFASSTGSSGGTRLGEVPVPPLAEIARDPQFEPHEVTRDEFEAAWSRHT